MSFAYLRVESVELLHAQLIETSGGSHGLRDRGLLASAIDRAENRAYYDPNASLPQVAATLAWGLIKNHAFIDGNKRIGLAVLIVFLGINGARLSCDELEETEMVLRAAASEITEDEWTAWVERSVAPLA